MSSIFLFNAFLHRHPEKNSAWVIAHVVEDCPAISKRGSYKSVGNVQFQLMVQVAANEEINGAPLFLLSQSSLHLLQGFDVVHLIVTSVLHVN